MFSGAEQLLAILVEGHPRNISVKYFEIELLAAEKMSFKGFLFLALAAILYSIVEQF